MVLAEAAACPAGEVQVAAGDFSLNPREEKLLASKIAEQERLSTGEIRIHLFSKILKGPALAEARRAFTALKMHNTKARNGVLIFIATKSHQVAILGDKGVHDEAGQKFWDEIIAEIILEFRKGDWLSGLSHAVEKVGAVLSKKFPRDPATDTLDENELSDEISIER